MSASKGCPACGKPHTMNEPCDFRKDDGSLPRPLHFILAALVSCFVILCTMAAVRGDPLSDAQAALALAHPPQAPTLPQCTLSAGRHNEGCDCTGPSSCSCIANCACTPCIGSSKQSAMTEEGLEWRRFSSDREDCVMLWSCKQSRQVGVYSFPDGLLVGNPNNLLSRGGRYWPVLPGGDCGKEEPQAPIPPPAKLEQVPLRFKPGTPVNYAPQYQQPGLGYQSRAAFMGGACFGST